MKKFFTVLIIIAILAVGAVGAWVLWLTKPVAKKKDIKTTLSIVEVLPLKLETLEVKIPSQGIVESTRRSVIASETAGKVISVSDKFNAGGTFGKDEIILELDKSDYQAALAQSKASLSDMKAALVSEQAKSDQAKRDWRRLGSGGKPNDLTVRGPQLRSAQARVDAADAAVKKSENDLKRATIRAPFPAAVTKTRTEIGSYLMPGAPVVEVFETGPFEIRLPLSIDEMQFLKIDKKGNPTGNVVITTTAAGITTSWPAKIIRTEREVDRASRSVYIVAEVTAKASATGITLQPGLFVEAKVDGQSFENIARVPFPSFLDLHRVVVVDPDDKIRFREVTILRREGKDVFVSKGLKNGERLCLTELPGMIEGTKVNPRLLKAEATPPKTDSKTKP